MNLIAETAWHHDGDFKFFKELVTAISKSTKVDYIKFHLTLDLDEYLHTDHPIYQWAQERLFSEKQWDEIFQIALNHNKRLMLLFNDKSSINFGMKYDPELVEIHSVCLNDFNLLNHLNNKISETRTKVVLGVGGTDLYEIEHAIQYFNSSKIILMHGFQNYPTRYSDINFSKVRKVMNLYPNFEHGYADHTAWDHENNIQITMFGAAMGMDYIEKHATIVPGEKRTDWQAAISIDSLNQIEKQLKILEEANGDGLLKMNKAEESYSTFGVMKKAAVLAKDVVKGDIFKLEDIQLKRTGQSSNLSQLNVIKSQGRRYTKDMIRGSIINQEDLS